MTVKHEINVQSCSNQETVVYCLQEQLHQLGLLRRRDIPIRFLWHKVWSDRLNTCLIYTKLSHWGRLNWTGNERGSLCILSIKQDSIRIETTLHLNRGFYVYKIHVINVLRRGIFVTSQILKPPDLALPDLAFPWHWMINTKILIIQKVGMVLPV
jgi:hypothetical protein